MFSINVTLSCRHCIRCLSSESRPGTPLHHALVAVDEFQFRQPEQVLGVVHPPNFAIVLDRRQGLLIVVMGQRVRSWFDKLITNGRPFAKLRANGITDN